MKHLPVALLVLVSLKLTYSDNAPSKFSEADFQKHIDILGAEFVTKVKSSEEKLLFKALVLQHSRDFQSGLVLGPVPLLEVLDDIISTLAGKDGIVDASVVNKIWTAINLKEEIGVNMEEKHRGSLKEITGENLENKTGVNPEANIVGDLEEKPEVNLKEITNVNLEERSGFYQINLLKKTSPNIKEKVISKQDKKAKFIEKDTEEKAGNIIENKGVKALSIMKDKARKSNLRKAGNSLRKWTGNSLKRKSGKSLNAKAGHQERKSRDFRTRNGLSSLLKRQKSIETRKKTDVKGNERLLLSVFSRKKKIPERRKYSFRISRSVSEDSTTTHEDDLETYTTQVPLTEERKSFLLSFFDAIKTKFDKEKEKE